MATKSRKNLDGKRMKFTIEVEMQDRWVPYFLQMLKYMQFLGRAGASKQCTFFADGDGDFRPEFKWDPLLPTEVEHDCCDRDGNKYYDAG